MTIEPNMDREKMKAFAREMAGHIRTQDELSQFSRELTKHLVEAALNGEMNHYRGMTSMTRWAVTQAIVAMGIPESAYRGAWGFGD